MAGNDQVEFGWAQFPSIAPLSPAGRRRGKKKEGRGVRSVRGAKIFRGAAAKLRQSS